MSGRGALMLAMSAWLVLGAVAAAAQQPVSELPDLEDTGVVIPWSDFKQILEQIRRPLPIPTPVPPPVAFAMSECAATVVVGADQRQVRVGLAFDVQVLEPEAWVEVPLLAERVALASVRMDGQPARLYRSNGAHTVALRGAGRHRFVLDYLVPVEDSRGTRTARLVIPRAPVVAVDLVLPRDDVDVQIDGAVVRSVARSGDTTRVQAALAVAGDTSVSWFPRIEAGDRGAKVFGELATSVAIGEGVLRGRSTASYSIHGDGVDTFRLEIPSDVTVLDVDAYGLRDWRIEDGEADSGDRRQMVVALNYLATGSTSFSFDFEVPLSGATVDLLLPDIAMLDVLRERGFVAIAASTNVEITPGSGLQNAAPVDPSELPASLALGDGESVLFAFKYLRHPVVVPLGVVKHRDLAVKRTIVDRADIHTFVNREGRSIVSARYTVRNNRKQFLEMTLPERATLWAAYLDERPIKAAARDDGVVLVPLRKTARDATGDLEPFTVEVVYYLNGRGLRALGSRRFEGPRLDVDVLELSWTLYLPRTRRYFDPDGNVDEDTSSNRLAVVGDKVYNLANEAEAKRLRVVVVDGRSMVTDGSSQVPIDELRVMAAGEERDLTAEEVGSITGRELDEGETRPGQPAPAQEEQYLARDVAAQIQSNVALAQGAFAGGKALGVLPVRISIPTDGVQLSFAGRLLTAGDAPHLRVRFVPAGWRSLRLSGLWVVVFGFALTLGLLAMTGHARRTGSVWMRAGAAAAAVGLVLVVVAVDGHWLLLILAVLAAVGGFAVWSRQPGGEGGF